MTRLPCVLRWAITMSLLSLLAAAAGPALAPAAIAVHADDLGGVPAADAAADADADAADLGGGGGSPDDSPSDGELVEDAILAGWQGLPGGAGAKVEVPKLWAGQNRSPQFMKYLKENKESFKCKREAKSSSEALGGVAQSWNRMHALRFGDRIHDAEAAKNRTAEKTAKPHPNQWNIGGMMRVAFEALGKAIVKHGRVAIGQTQHAMAAMSVTASIYRHVQSEGVRGFWGEATTTTSRIRSVLVNVHYDATPVVVTFGSLQPALWQHARYLHRDGDRWRLLAYDKYQALSKRAAPKFGVVELLAQTRDLHYIDSGSHKHLEIKILPCILQRSNASTIFEAVESAVPCRVKQQLQKTMFFANKLFCL